MNISLLSTWFVGAANGYTLNTDHHLSNSIKYGTMALATGAQLVKGVANISLPITSVKVLGPIFTLIPIGVGATFCLGSYVGKSLKHVRTLD